MRRILAFALLGLGARAEAQEPLVGQPFGSFDGVAWVDGPLRFQDSPLTLIRWWTDECPFCSDSVPELSKLAQQVDGLRFVGMYHPKPPRPVSAETVRAEAGRIGFAGTLAQDPEWKLLRALQARGLPRRATSVSLLVDRHGVIRWVHPGPRLHGRIGGEHEQAEADFFACHRVVQDTLRSLREGSRRYCIESPGGPIEFGLELRGAGAHTKVALINGDDYAEFDAASWDGKDLRVTFRPYDSHLTARVDEAGALRGSWRRRSGGDRWTTMPFRSSTVHWPAAKEGGNRNFESLFPGRWRVQFEHDEHPAVGIFETIGGYEMRGTFLTARGDYRYLYGFDYGLHESPKLVLSCFDGAHAFLFTAELLPDRSIQGEFWSGGSPPERWTAVRDDRAELPDAFGLTKARDGIDLASLRYPDLDGKRRSLADDAFRGKARIVQVFGSWCPNCNDASRLLTELDERYRDHGLRILGLAFEHTGEHAHDAARVREYLARAGASYPVLLAGTSDKAAASAAFPLLDRVRAYPTTIFLDRDDRVRAVHTGFSGPATGAEHAKLRARFEELIEDLLAGR